LVKPGLVAQAEQAVNKQETSTDREIPSTAKKSPASGRRTISITEGLKTKPVAEMVNGEEIIKGETHFTAEDLQKVWLEFASKLQKDGRLTLHTALGKRNPVLNADYSIHLSLDNGAVEKDIAAIKAELLTYIRRKLNNGKITLSTSLDKDPNKGKVPYTPKEKFEHMTVKNPALGKLKKQMDLEIDF
jgi:hypothetical protein